MTIFIVGYMASGKTTFGKALARRTGMTFIDLDFYIEQRFHTTIRNLFITKGEKEFRRIESVLLREAGEFDDVIVSCGGGTPCFADNMDYMKRRGLTVRLAASEHRLAERILQGGDKRPLMAGKNIEEIIATIREHLPAREPFYSQASVTISGEKLETKDQISTAVEEFLQKHLHIKE